MNPRRALLFGGCGGNSLDLLFVSLGDADLLSLVRFRGIILLDVWKVIDSVVQPGQRGRELGQQILVRVLHHLDNDEKAQIGIGHLVPNKETFMKNLEYQL